MSEHTHCEIRSVATGEAITLNEPFDEVVKRLNQSDKRAEEFELFRPQNSGFGKIAIVNADDTIMVLAVSMRKDGTGAYPVDEQGEPVFENAPAVLPQPPHAFPSRA